jgi:hypothetical protein
MATADEKYELITRRLQEVLGADAIKAILAEGRQPKCYWGTYHPGISSAIDAESSHLQGLPRRDDVRTIQLIFFGCLLKW